jgi:hypothetical protein
VKIISGGQTGADRAALDWAIKNNVEHGGWCPKGRKAEDGAIASCYLLKESSAASYLQRTEWNVRDSDGTVIFTIKPSLSGGSKRTAEFAEAQKKPWLHVSAADKEIALRKLTEFIKQHNISVLNVAGSRSSKEPGVAEFVMKTLAQAFKSECT